MKIALEGNRRMFMKSAAIIGGLAALFGIGRRAVSSKPAEPQAQQEQPPQGYRLTEHVRKYYDTARM
jgi:hypothetical protein